MRPDRTRMRGMSMTSERNKPEPEIGMATILGTARACVRTDIERVAPERVEEMRAYSVPLVGDSYGRERIMDWRIKPLHDGMFLCGPAITVDLPPNDNLMLHAAIRIAQPGDVIVAATDGDPVSGVWGEIMTLAARKKGIAGLILDGACRDKAEIIDSGWPVFCRAVIPQGSGKVGPGRVNMPIACGGVVVEPGDLVLGDADGVVVVRRQEVVDALEKAHAKLAAERKRIAGIEDGIISASWLLPELKKLGIEIG